MLRKICLLAPLLLAPLRAQDNPNQQEILREVLRRLDTLEQQNRELLQEVKELKQQSNSPSAETPEAAGQPSPPPLEERVKVNEERIAEQAQTKVESQQKLPVWLYGTLLFNSFYNDNKDAANALGSYGLLSGAASSGATVRQTILGLNFQGPSLPGNGHVSGNLEMDFWGGPPGPSSNWLRIRRAGLSFDWTNTTFFVGQDKPLISPYEPDSLAEVAIPALSGSGNLWFWLPQARVTHSIPISARNGIDAQVAVLQVGSYLESNHATPGLFPGGVRPALEGRVAFWHKDGDTRKFEFAPGFHISRDRVNGSAVTARIGSLDWLYAPFAMLNFKGAAYYGEDVAALGGLGNGFYLAGYGTARPVVSGGGWAQVSAPIDNRITLNLFGGLEHDRASGIQALSIAQAGSVAGNVMFHLTSNTIFSLEAQRLWTTTFMGTPETYNHYDLAVAYLF